MDNTERDAPPKATTGTDSELGKRLELITTVLGSPPKIHKFAPTGVWNTNRACYEFMARQVRPGWRTLETGCGVSTVLFAGWGCDHLCVVPAPKEREGILEYCTEQGVDQASLSFDLRASEWALPDLPPDAAYDLVFIDGSHGFPLPIIDWFYGAAHLREGGIVMLDDRNLAQVNLLVEWFLDRDPRWELLQSTSKWAAYRRHSSGPLGEIQTFQPFIQSGDYPPLPSARDVARAIAHRVRGWSSARRTSR
jgi:hypothetical protein